MKKWQDVTMWYKAYIVQHAAVPGIQVNKENIEALSE